MKNLIRGMVVAGCVGFALGWLAAEHRRDQQEQAKRDAYANDPERIADINALRVQIAMDEALGLFDGMELSDES